MTINGTNYSASIVKGKVTFENIVLPAGNYTGIIIYPGGDYYNLYSTSIKFEVTDVSEGNKNQDNINQTAHEETEIQKDINQTVPEENDIHKYASRLLYSKQTGNPINIALLILVCLISNNILRRKR